EPARGDRAAERNRRGRALARERALGVERAALGGRAPRGGARAPPAVRSDMGWVRRGAEVPAADDARVPPAAPPPRGPGGARARDGHARSDGRRRDIRPGGRRLPPLLDGRPMARPALREDALRQRAPRAAIRVRLSDS